MTTPHAEAAASASTTVAKTLSIWGGVAAGFTSLPWAQLAACAAFVWSLHLIVGWWIDRLKK